MRMRRVVLAVALGALLLPLPEIALGEIDPLSLARERHSQRLAGIDYFVKVLQRNAPMEPSSLGSVRRICRSNCVVHKVERYTNDTEKADQTEIADERPLSQMEVAQLAGASPGAAFFEYVGLGMVGFQAMFNEQLTGQQDPTGTNRILMEYFLHRAHGTRVGSDARSRDVVSATQPWLDPFAMVGASGFMMLETAMAVREAEESLAMGAKQAIEEAGRGDLVLKQLEPTGVEDFDGARAMRYSAEDLDLRMGVADGQEVLLNGADVWVDTEQYVFLAHRFEGTLAADGESTEFFIQTTNSDFRHPPGCGEMYEPYKRVLQMGGILDDEQMAEMQEAKQQLEELDRQLASLPAEQRRLTDRMMGGQMEKLRNLATTGTLHYTEVTEEILCNPDLKTLFAPPGEGGVTRGDVVTSPEELLRGIQRDLVTLGYQPGNTDGVLDTMTQIAISQFQAEHGLPVNGEPSARLASHLASEVERQA